MHTSTILSMAVLIIPNFVIAHTLVERATVDGPCTGAGGAPGVCIATAKCTSGGGTHISNACPGTPNDIRCCTKSSCGSGGNCRFTSQCSTTTLTDLCPGPADFKCCVPGGTTPGGGTGGYPTPRIPSVGACKAPAVGGAQKVVAGNPGAVREIYCTRDCACPGTSDHCCGLAIDFMCSSGGGVSVLAVYFTFFVPKSRGLPCLTYAIVQVRTDSGRSIAEWVMNNRAALNLKYVIWGQKIWTTSRDSVGPWSGWRGMEDRGSITANHWYVLLCNPNQSCLVVLLSGAKDD
ncbi:MAG: hypothetical protein Q9224_000001 [Gallowayella concinna]